MKKIFEIFSLKGKVAVVTGGTGVLGSSISQGLGEAGAKICLLHLHPRKEVVENLRKKKIVVRDFLVDVLRRESLEICREKILKEFGRIDILVNCAGGNVKEATCFPEQKFFDLPLSGLEKVVGLNLFGGAILPSQVFGKAMVKNEEGGSIINISSMASLRPLTRVVGYSASKAAVNNFTQWLAVHLAREYSPRLRVNAICPGFFLTPQNRWLLIEETGNLTPRGKSVLAHTPMGEFGKPEDLIGVSIWLASSASRFVTGAVIPVDGGFSAFSGV